MVDAALGELEAVGVTDKPGVVVADAGYWHSDQMDAIEPRDPGDRAPGRGREKAATARLGRWPLRVMRRVLATEAGGRGEQIPLASRIILVSEA